MTEYVVGMAALNRVVGGLCSAVHLSWTCTLPGMVAAASKSPRRHGLAMLEVRDQRDLQLTHALTSKAYSAQCHDAAAAAAQSKRKCKHSILMDRQCNRVPRHRHCQLSAAKVKKRQKAFYYTRVAG